MKLKSKLFAILFGLVLMLALAACGGNDNDNDTGNNDTGTDTEEPAEQDGGEATEEDGGEAGGDGGTVDTAAAEQIFANNCAMCHGADLSGGAGPNLQTIGSKYSQEEIHDIIVNGKGGMPAVNISDEDANTVAAWLASKK
jgi:cytochrome c551